MTAPSSDDRARAAELLRELATADGARSVRLRLRVDNLRWRQEQKRDEQEISCLVSSRAEGGAGVGGPAASYLDHLGISDPSRENPADGDPPPPADPARATFLAPDHPLAQVERLTEPHRRTKAARHAAAAAAAVKGLRDLTPAFEPREVDAVAPQRTAEERAAWPAPRRAAVILPRNSGAVGRTLDERAELGAAAERTRRWHAGRSRGALQRFERVTTCGKKKVRAKCNACGTTHEVPDRCGCDRLCQSCRKASRKHRVARLADAQLRVLTDAKRRGLFNRHRAGGAWGERILTLTVPHFALEWEPTPDVLRHDRTVDARIDALFRAWRRFSLRLQRWGRAVARRSRKRLPEWYRSFEWTPGDDGKGHPHFHLWIFSPFLPFSREAQEANGFGNARSGVQDWWREALAAEGIEGAEHAICDVRGAYDRDPNKSGIRAEVAKGAITVNHDGRRVQRYVEGWSILDVCGDGSTVTDEVKAALYESLDGRRLVATSPRLLTRRSEGCGECGAVGWMRTEIIDPAMAGACGTLQGAARSPP